MRSLYDICSGCGEDFGHHSGDVKAYCPYPGDAHDYWPDRFFKASAHDPINPAHYKDGRRFEVIDVIEDFAQFWPPEVILHLANMLKYAARCGQKGGIIEDLKKARWYLDRAISRLEG